jgi:hypothetical protein
MPVKLDINPLPSFADVNCNDACEQVRINVSLWLVRDSPQESRFVDTY